MTAAPSPDELVLTNGDVDVRVARTHGPRVTWYGFAGGENLFASAPDAARATPGGLWRAYGGHRLWAAPESFPQTYTIDDAPPEIEATELAALVRRAYDPHAPLAVEIALALDARGTGVHVTHRLHNAGAAPLRVAPWGITIVPSGGVAVIPNAAYRRQPDALRPARPLAVWHYTALDDARLRWGKHAVSVRCDPEQAEPFKIGFGNERGWFAYVRRRTAFIVRTAYDPAADYPDFGCSTEVYTEGAFCEVESLAPLTWLNPGATVEHRETWSLASDVDVDDEPALVERLEDAR